jgi:hypothetical protein
MYFARPIKLAEMLPFPEDVRRAIDKLRSLHDGDLGFVEITACGTRAVPALRALLLEREPSGLYQPRCLAAQALARLGAYDTLIDFLSERRDIVDPVERVGVEAVINAAARALAGLREERVFCLLMGLAERQLLPGVIAALGAFQRAEAIPYLVAALAEDGSRAAAEAALAKYGPTARQALLVAAARGSPLPADRESESSARRRRSALNLLAQMGVGAHAWPVIRPLMHDEDSQIAVLACKIGLASAPISESPDAIHRLIGLLRDVEWMLGAEIEECLVAHFDRAREIIAAIVSRDDSTAGDDPRKTRMVRALLRVRARGEAVRRKGNAPNS